MKTIILSLLTMICFVYYSKAQNSPLRWNEIYNFNVGDSFEYHYYNNQFASSGGPTFDYNYFVVIQGKYVSNDSVHYNIGNSQPSSYRYDTNFVYKSDSGYFTNSLYTFDSTVIDSSKFHGRKQCNSGNDIIAWDFDEKFYAKGLGCFHNFWRHEVCSCMSYTELIYYNKLGEKWGARQSTVGVENVSKQTNDEIKIYPTISDGDFSIYSKEKIKKIVVYNSLGAFLFNPDTNNKLNLSSFENGVYFISVQTINKIEVIRIVKQ